MESDHEAARVAQSPLSTASCQNGILKEEHTALRHIGASVTSRICNPVAGGVPTMVSSDDATGKQVDLNQLREADSAAFHSWHAGIQPDFRASMEKAENDAHEVYVWFYVDQTDAPEKEWVVGEPLAAHAVSTVAESRIRTGALQLAGKLSAAGAGVVTDTVAPTEYGIPVVRVRAKLAVLDTVGTWPEVWRIDRVPREEEHTLLSDTYYYTTVESWPDYFGYDGTGVTVATYEGKFPDSWANLPGAPSGSCIDEYGTGGRCHCPGAQHRGDHPRGAMGVVRRSTGVLGMANGATTIMANYGDCTTNGPDVYASALNWATTNGATVISHSACTGTGADPNAHDIFFDYKASVSPYPLVAAAAGNISGANVCNKLRNGLVVGGTLEYNDSSNRSLAYADLNRSYLNGTNGASGYEVPHVSAISLHVSSAGHDPLTTDPEYGGTSAAAPQVAGLVASMQELNTALKSWPEAMVPAIMASADEDTHGDLLALGDGVDDRDGAGLISGYRAPDVVLAKLNGGNTPSQYGHDYGTIYSSSTPAWSLYSEQYSARVYNGWKARIAAFLQTRPTCPQNPGSSSCGPNPYPIFWLLVYDGTTLVASSTNANNNYQYVAITNTSGSQKDYVIKLYLVGWNGLSSTTFGVAWSATP